MRTLHCHSDNQCGIYVPHASTMRHTMRSWSHWRFELLALACWACANLVVYWNLTEDDSTACQPTRAALKLYQPLTRTGQIRDSRSTLSLPYRLMPPPRIESRKRYPLVCFLHGAGERGSDNRTQLFGLPEQLAEPEWRNTFPSFVLAPQCPETSYWTNHDAELLSLIDDVSHRYSIDPDRIYLTGLSMGGYGTWSLAARAPDRFAAIVPICGGGDTAWATKLIDVPIWAVHGDADPSVNVRYTREMIAAIREAGGQPRYTELPGIGHDSWTQTYRGREGVVKWMFEQRNSRRSRSTDK